LAPVQIGPAVTRSTWEQGAAVRIVSSAEPLMEFHPSECSPTPRSPSRSFRSSRTSTERRPHVARYEGSVAPSCQGRIGNTAGSVQPHHCEQSSIFLQNFSRDIAAIARGAGSPLPATECRSWPLGRSPTQPILDQRVARPRRGPVIRPRRRVPTRAACVSTSAGNECRTTSAHSYRTLERDG
jgi:hypothetical protein